MQKYTEKYIINTEKELDNIDLKLEKGDRIFFVGDLGAGKSTFIRYLLRKYFDNPALIVRSPTYTYYQRYTQEINGTKEIGDNTDQGDIFPPTLYSLSSVYHMDLYRLEEYDTFISIGGEEVLEDKDAIILIEWPEILGESVTYTKKISIELIEDEKRKITIVRVSR